MKSSLDMSSLKVYAVPVAALLVVGVCVPLVLLPGYESLQKNLTTQSERQKLVEDLNAKVETLKNIDIDQTKAVLDESLLIAVPAEPDAAGLLGSLEKLAQDNGLSTSAVNYVTSEDPDAAPSSAATDLDPTQLVAQNIAAALSVSGSYDRVMSYIAKAEASIRLTSFTGINITLDESVSNGVIATLNVESPYIAHPTNLGPAELPLPSLDTSDDSPALKTLRSLNKIGYTGVDPDTIQGKTNPF